jgi:acyl carrier protein
VLADATLANQTPGGIRAALAPKLDSALLWERAVGLHPSTMHVTFSSVAALLGSPGQANYSAANAALDALAAGWQARGAAGLSIQWGAWAEGGMAAANAGTAKAVERMGMGMVAPEAGMGAMQALLLRVAAEAAAVTAAVPFRWAKFMARQRAVPPMLEQYRAFWAGGEAAAPAALDAAPPAAALEAPPGQLRRAAPAAAAPAVSKEILAVQVQEAVIGVLGIPVGGDDALMAAGLDSLGAVELKNALERRAGMELPSTLVFDYPTVNALAAYLALKLPSIGTPAPADADAQQQALVAAAGDSFYHDHGDEFVPSQLQPAAPRPPAQRLVGISELVSRSAGDALLQLCPSDQPRPVPVERWDAEAQAELCGGLPVQFGVFLGGVAAFDAAALSLSDTEASLMDPQQRLLLETLAEAALAHPAEMADDALRADWGVFVVSRGFVAGCAPPDPLIHTPS